MKRILPSSSISFPWSSNFAYGSSAALAWDGRDDAVSGFSVAYSFNSSSHLASLSCKS